MPDQRGAAGGVKLVAPALAALSSRDFQFDGLRAHASVALEFTCNIEMIFNNGLVCGP